MDQMYRSGQIVPDDQLWSAELGDWKYADEVLGPFGKSPPPPPVPSRAARASHAVVVAPEPPRETVTRTVVEGGSFKFGTFLWIVLGLFVPLWPITLPLCWFMAYRSYKKPAGQTIRVITS